MNARLFIGSRNSVIYLGLASLLAVTGAEAQLAQGSTGSYQQEVQACMSGQTPQDQATCLKEARNAQADKKRGLLDSGYANFQANALARCEVFKGEDKAACHARMMSGNVSGSVGGGGVLREVETVVTPPGSSPAPNEQGRQR